MRFSRTIAVFCTLLFAPPVFADATLYVFGLGDIFSAALGVIKYIEGSIAYKMILTSFILVGFVLHSARKMEELDIRGLLWAVFWIMAVASMLTHKVNVDTVDYIDRNTGTEQIYEVDAVPALLVIPSWFTSTAGDILQSLVHDGLTVITPEYSKQDSMKNGFNIAGRLVKEANKITFSDPIIKTNFEQYFNTCTVYAMYKDQLSGQRILTAADVWSEMKYPSPTLLVEVYEMDGSDWVWKVKSCEDATDILQNQITNAAGAVLARIQGKTGINMDASNFETKLANSYGMLLNSGVGTIDGGGIAVQSAMINTLRDVYSRRSVAAGANDYVLAVNSEQALQASEANLVVSAGIGSGTVAIYLLGTIQVVAAFFSLVVVLMLSIPGKGVSLLISYIKLLFWVVLIPTGYEIISYINYLINVNGARVDALTPGTRLFITEAAQKYSNVAQYMIVLIPITLWMLINKDVLDFSSGWSSIMGGSGPGASASSASVKDSMGYGSKSANSVSYDKYNLASSMSHGGSGWTASGGTAVTDLVASNDYSGQSLNGQTITKTSSIGSKQDLQQAQVREKSAATKQAQSRSTAIGEAIGEAYSHGAKQSSSVTDRTSSGTSNSVKKGVSNVAQSIETLTENSGRSLTKDEVFSSSQQIVSQMKAQIKSGKHLTGSRIMATALGSQVFKGLNSSDGKYKFSGNAQQDAKVWDRARENEDMEKIMSELDPEQRQALEQQATESYVKENQETMAQKAEESGNASVAATMAGAVALASIAFKMTPVGRVYTLARAGLKMFGKTATGRKMIKGVMRGAGNLGDALLSTLGLSAEGSVQNTTQTQDASKKSESFQFGAGKNMNDIEAKLSTNEEALTVAKSKDKSMVRALEDSHLDTWGVKVEELISYQELKESTDTYRNAVSETIAAQRQVNIQAKMFGGGADELANQRIETSEIKKPKKNGQGLNNDEKTKVTNAINKGVNGGPPNPNFVPDAVEGDAADAGSDAKTAGDMAFNAASKVDYTVGFSLKSQGATLDTQRFEAMSTAVAQNPNTAPLQERTSMAEMLVGKDGVGNLVKGNTVDDKVSQRLASMIGEKYDINGMVDGQPQTLTDMELQAVYKNNKGGLSYQFKQQGNDNPIVFNAETGSLTTKGVNTQSVTYGDEGVNSYKMNNIPNNGGVIPADFSNQLPGAPGSSVVDNQTGDIYIKKNGSDYSLVGQMNPGVNSDFVYVKSGVNLNKLNDNVSAQNVNDFADRGYTIDANGQRYQIKGSQQDGGYMLYNDNGKQATATMTAEQMASHLNGLKNDSYQEAPDRLLLSETVNHYNAGGIESNGGVMNPEQASNFLGRNGSTVTNVNNGDIYTMRNSKEYALTPNKNPFSGLYSSSGYVKTGVDLDRVRNDFTLDDISQISQQGWTIKHDENRLKIKYNEGANGGLALYNEKGSQVSSVITQNQMVEMLNGMKNGTTPDLSKTIAR